MSDDMRNLALEYKDKLKQKQLDDLAFTEKQRLLKDLGPKRWMELRQLIKIKVDDFNAEMDGQALSWDDNHSDRISITRKADGIHLEGGYDGLAKTAFFRSPETAINLNLIQVVLGNNVVFATIDPKTKAEFVNDPEPVAYGLLRDFLSR